MKRNLFLAALLCLAVGASAQENPRIARLGAYEQDGPVSYTHLTLPTIA